MNWKKTSKYFAVLLTLTIILISYGANRDMIRIYGGLTKRVDLKQFDLQPRPISIRNVNVLSPDGERFVPDQTVTLKDGKIVSIDKQSSANNALTVDGMGKYLIPGLTDAHVHLFKSPNDLLLYVASGVTQVRELIGEADHLEWRQEIENGGIGPDMFIASPRIGSFGAMQGWFMSWSQGFLNISTAAEAEVEVRKLNALGYDAVKIYSHINKESYLTVVRVAKELGMRVVGHVPFALKMSDIYPHQDEVSHLEELMNAMNREFGGFSADTSTEFLAHVRSRTDDVALQLRNSNTAVTTTLWLVESFVRQKVELDKVLTEVELEYQNPGISEWSSRASRGIGWLPGVNRYEWPDDWDEARRAESKHYWETYTEACRIILQSLVKNEVQILAGTDANLPPAVPGFSLHDEFISLNKAGMSPAQILRSATSQPAEWLNSNSGSITPGRKANLVLLDKNPLRDIRNTKSINSVLINGRLLNRAMLDEILAAVREANGTSRNVDISRYLH